MINNNPPPKQRTGGLFRPAPASAQSIPQSKGDVVEELYSPTDLITEEEVMEWLTVDKYWMADHRTRIEPIIPHSKLGKTIRYSRRAIQQWLQECVQSKPSWDRPKRAA